MKKNFILLFCSLIILANNKYYKSRFIELQIKIPKTKIAIQKFNTQLKNLKESKLLIQEKLHQDKENLSLRDKLIVNIFKQETIIDKKTLFEKKLIAIKKETELLKKILNTTISLNPKKIPASSRLQDSDYLTFDFNKIAINYNFQKQLENKIFNSNLEKKIAQIKQFIWTFKLKKFTINKNIIEFVPFITVQKND